MNFNFQLQDGKSNTTCIKKYNYDNSNKINTRLLFVRNCSFVSTVERTTAAYPEYREVSVMGIRYTSGKDTLLLSNKVSLLPVGVVMCGQAVGTR